MGKGSRLRREKGTLTPGNGKDEQKIWQSPKEKEKEKNKDDQNSQPCKRCEDEISNLRQLNQRLTKHMNTSRQDLEACFLHKVAKMESQIQFLQAASTNFESKMDNQFIEQVKNGEQLSEQLIEIDKKFRQQLAKKDEESDGEISKAWQQLQEAEERFKREISEKEKDYRAVVSDKQTLETSVLQLTDKIKVISAELDTARNAWEFEKNGLFSQIVAARKESEETAKNSLIAEQAWNADKENLLSTYEKKIEDMSALNQRVLLEKIELDSRLNESEEKLEDDRHSWDSEKQSLQANAAELQAKIDSMAGESGLLCQKNRALSAQVESLKAQLNENMATLAQMRDERVQNERVLQQYRTENIDLNDSREKTEDLLRKFEEDAHLWGAEKSNLEGTVAELNTKHELMATEMGSLTQKNRELRVEAEFVKNKVNALESELSESKERSRELLEKLEDDRHSWDSQKQSLQGNVAELQTKIDSMASESGLLCQKNRALSAQVESLKAQLNENIATLAQMQDERVQNERFLQQYRTENIELQSNLNNSKVQTQDLRRKIEEDTRSWDAEKSKLEGTVAELNTKHELMASEMGSLTQKNRELTVEAEFVKNKVNELESQQSESKERSRILLEKLEDDRHSWDSEKQSLQGNVAELQKKIDSMASESGLLCQKNSALSAQVESLKAQFNENIAMLAQMQDKRVQNERVLQQYRTENIELLSNLNNSKVQTQDLRRKIEEDMRSWDAEKSKLEGTVAELNTKHELMASEMESLTQKNKELTVQAEFVKNKVNELESELSESKERSRELLEKLEDDRHSWDSEKQSLQGNVAELQTKIDSMASESGLLCQKNRALSAQVESLKARLNENIVTLAQMEDERVQNERVLQQYITENIDLQSNVNNSKVQTQDLLRKIEEDTRLWDAERSKLEGTVAEFRARASEMGSLTQKNRELTVDAELMKNKVNALESELNEAKKKSLELLQKNEQDWHLWDEKKGNLEGTISKLQTEQEDLMLQLSKKKAPEEELLATMSSLEAMKESTSKGEIEIANLRSQLFAVTEEKDGQLSHLQRQLSAMAEEKKSQLVELSSIAEGKNMIEEENKSLRIELDRRTLVSEEEKVRLEDRVRELQTTFNSLNEELESSRTIAAEKERQFVDLQNRHSQLVEAKKCLEDKNESLLSELDENIGHQNRISELEREVESLKKDIESKDNCTQKLTSENQPPWRKAVAPVVHGNARPKVPPEKRTVQKREPPEPTPKVVPERRSLNPKPNLPLHENPKPKKSSVHENEKSKATPRAVTNRQPAQPTPNAQLQRRSQNLAPQNPKPKRFP